MTLLEGVASTGPRDVWAVGWYDASGGVRETLAEHWNGRRWTRVPTQNPYEADHMLNGVAAIAVDDAWAVGSSAGEQLIEHWDGTAWSQVSGDHGGVFQFDELESVSGTAREDVWAGGYGIQDDEGHTPYPLAEHWDGSRWTYQHLPLAHPGEIRAIHAAAPSDVWAVGEVYSDRGHVQHFTDDWHRIFEDPARHPELLAAASSGPSDVWFGGPERSMLHWNGRRLKNEALDALSGSVVWGADALSPRDAWAVGVAHDDFPIAEHWDGVSWTETFPRHLP